MYLSRIRLRPSAQLRALIGKVDGSLDKEHRLLSSLFADAYDQFQAASSGGTSEHPLRPFLFRREENNCFIVLSRTQPQDHLSLFDIEQKQFAPKLLAGDALSFRLRANAVVSRKAKTNDASTKRTRGVRHDVTMDALHSVPKEARAQKRYEVAECEGVKWLSQQLVNSGAQLRPVVGDEFCFGWDEETTTAPLLDCRLNAYEVVQLKRSHKGGGHRAGTLGIVDLEGTLIVNDPTEFIGTVARGFGKAKAFGCGLMLLKRAGPVG